MTVANPMFISETKEQNPKNDHLTSPQNIAAFCLRLG